MLTYWQWWFHRISFRLKAGVQKIAVLFSSHSEYFRGKLGMNGLSGKQFQPYFQANVHFLYPLKTPDNQRFSDVFRGYRNRTLVWNMLIKFISTFYEVHQKIFVFCKMQLKHGFFRKYFQQYLLHSCILSALLDTQGAGPTHLEIFTFIYLLYIVVLLHWSKRTRWVL